MPNQTIVITGATSGIGFAGAAAMASLGWRVLVHGRSPQSARAACEALRQAQPAIDIVPVSGDLSTRRGVEGLAQEIIGLCSKLDALWNNAGMSIGKRIITEDGWELEMAVNHMAPFILTKALLPILQAGGGGRVIGTSSMAQAFGSIDFNDWMGGSQRYSFMGIYSKTKLCNVLFTRELAARFGNQGITAHCFHPGWIKSDINRSRVSGKEILLSKFLFLAAPAPVGADTGVFLATDPLPLQTNGGYWVKRRPAKTNKLNTPENAHKLWELSENALILGK